MVPLVVVSSAIGLSMTGKETWFPTFAIRATPTTAPSRTPRLQCGRAVRLVLLWNWMDPNASSKSPTVIDISSIQERSRSGTNIPVVKCPLLQRLLRLRYWRSFLPQYGQQSSQDSSPRGEYRQYDFHELGLCGSQLPQSMASCCNELRVRWYGALFGRRDHGQQGKLQRRPGIIIGRSW